MVPPRKAYVAAAKAPPSLGHVKSDLKRITVVSVGIVAATIILALVFA